MPDRFCFFAVLKTDDAATLACLRGLAFWAQQKVSKFKSWKGTGEDEWNLNGNEASFKFTSDEFRSSFLAAASRLLDGRYSVQNLDPPAPD